MVSKPNELHRKRKRRHQATQFKRSYPRIKRNNYLPSPEYVSDDMRNFIHKPEGIPEMEYVATKETPSDHLSFLLDVELHTLSRLYNPILLFRMLKLMYGEPDILGAWATFSDEEQKLTIHSPFDVDWGYTLYINDDLVAEIRTFLANKESRIRFWRSKIFDKDQHDEAIREAMEKCIKALEEAIEKNCHLFDEHEDLKSVEHAKRVATVNVYFTNYHSATRLLGLAKEYDKRQEKLLYVRPLPEEFHGDLFTFGFLHSAAAFFYTLSLEAFTNTIFNTLIKEEFSDKDSLQDILRMDWDLRLRTMHLLCKGFLSPAIIRGSEEWNEFIKLKNFRNLKFHGNIADEDEGSMILEDGIFFFYHPWTHFRGRNLEKKAEKAFARSSFSDPALAISIKESVDAVVEKILLAMDSETRQWVTEWLHQPYIPRL